MLWYAVFANVLATGDAHPIAGSGYLGAVIPHSAQLDAILNVAFVEKYQRGTDLLVARRYPDAIDEFRAALKWNPDSVEAHNNLGIALASIGRMDEAVDARRNLAMASRQPATGSRQ